MMLPLRVQRYRCLEPGCPRVTFSLLPPQVMRYSRFFWPCLLALKLSVNAGATPYHLAHHVWGVGRGVIVRARALLAHMERWVQEQYRELSDGGPPRELELMVKLLSAKLGRVELVERWFCHRYPRRFARKIGCNTI